LQDLIVSQLALTYVVDSRLEGQSDPDVLPQEGGGAEQPEPRVPRPEPLEDRNDQHQQDHAEGRVQGRHGRVLGVAPAELVVRVQVVDVRRR